jgi:hypothetical protein
MLHHCFAQHAHVAGVIAAKAGPPIGRNLAAEVRYQQGWVPTHT